MPELTTDDVARWMKAANSGDINRMMAEFADDATAYGVLGSGRYVGKQAIRTWLSGVLVSFPDLREELKTVVVRGNEALGVETMTGTHTGPIRTADGKEIPPTHRKFSWDLMVHLVADETGRIKSYRLYGNPLELFQQLGLGR